MNTKPFRVPVSVAVCPICGARLWICDITGWTQQDNGEWVPDEFDIDCATEPDITSRKWESWHNWHYAMPYVDWLPVHGVVERWVAQNFRMIEVEGEWKLERRGSIAPCAT